MRALRIAIGLIAAALAAGTAAADSIEDKAAVCGACHGENGKPASPEIPIIWGQTEGYIYIELRDFKSGARKNDLMAGIMATLEKDDILALASYFSQKPWTNLGQPSADAASTKEAQIVSGSAQCEGCHLAGYLGESVTPRLAGQSETYLLKQMQAFRAKERTNNAWMVDLLKTYSDQDMVALAKYLAGL